MPVKRQSNGNAIEILKGEVQARIDRVLERIRHELQFIMEARELLEEKNVAKWRRDEAHATIKNRNVWVTEAGIELEKLRGMLSELDNEQTWINSEVEPIRLHGYWLYQNNLYRVTGLYSDDQKRLLISTEAAKEKRKFERLRLKLSREEAKEQNSRQRIPEEVRNAVWRRDEGKCARCGSRENLEFDHIIPISMGGSSTARNLELLCELCNRSKGKQI
jgi:HNH endonuclease